MPPLLRDRTSERPTPTRAGPTTDAHDAPAPTAEPGRTGVAGPTEVVEARSASAAVAEVQRKHGTGARIVTAEKVLRGGIGGFFARELVQLTVAVGETWPPPDPSTAAPVQPPAPASVVRASATAPDRASGPLADVLASGLDDGPAEETFGQLLDRRAAAADAVEPGPSGHDGVARTVGELARQTDDREQTFGDALRAAAGVDDGGEEDAEVETAATSLADGPRLGQPGSVLVLRGAASLLDRGRIGAGPLADGAEHVSPTPPATSPAPAVATADRDTATAAEVAPASSQRLELDDLGLAAAAQVSGSGGADAGPEPVHHLRGCVRRSDVDRRRGRAPTGVRPLRSSPDEQDRARTTSSSQSHGWTADRLARIGLSDQLVAAVVARRPVDDIGWFDALARTLAPLCPPLAATAEVVVGRHADRFATALAAPPASEYGHASPRGSFSLAAGRTARVRRWLADERRGRAVHLVVGGEGWRDWLLESPDVLSWCHDDDLVPAVDAAVRFGAVLGWRWAEDDLERATPVDLAVSIRRRLVGT